jgi:predicted O-methyltransferase YrrM
VALDGARIVPRREFILADMVKGGRVVEVGTQEGLYAEKILALCQPDELHLIDINLGPLHARGNGELLGRAILHEGDSSTILRSFPDEHFDWLYLDAGHFYSEVKADVEVAKTKVKRGGHIIFNDYCLWSSVEFTAYGVPYAAHELILEHGWRVTHLALNKLFYFDLAVQRP